MLFQTFILKKRTFLAAKQIYYSFYALPFIYERQTNKTKDTVCRVASPLEVMRISNLSTQFCG